MPKLYAIVTDDEPVMEFLSEKEIIAEANNQRVQFMEDEGEDDPFIKEEFPNPISTFKEAIEFFKAFSQYVAPVPSKSTLTQRVLKKVFDNNGSIKGKLKKKDKDYFDQGWWNFEIKILDIDELFNVTLQLESKKICPSGAWDNGIRQVEHVRTSLYSFGNTQDISLLIRSIITRYFKSDRNARGREYTIEEWHI